jgi:DNA-binding NarL/FixJ family response regulator
VKKVLLVDDHQLFRCALQALVRASGKELAFAEANDCESAIDLEDKDEIDLVLLDFYLPGTEGFEALKLIKQHYKCGVVVLSGENNPHVIRSAINKGAVGYIPKSTSGKRFEHALDTVLDGEPYLPPEAVGDYTDSVEQIDDTPDNDNDDILSQLTKRQLDVLTMAIQGNPNKVIARALYIAEGTVKAHLSACFRVLEVENRTEALYAIVALGLSRRVSISTLIPNPK